MNEEENNNQEEMQDNKLEQAVGRAGKQVVEETSRKAAKKIKNIIIQAIAKFITLFGIKLIIIFGIFAAAVCILSAIDDFLDGETAEVINEATNESINEYCTIAEDGVHFDKEKFIATISDKMEEELKIKLSDLGLGETTKDANGNEYLNADSQAAKYLYKFMAASLSSELPYIEGSDDETKGIIRIKRKQKGEEPAKDLKYIGYEKFQNMINSDDMNTRKETLKYFSLDQSWNLCVTKWTSTSENGQETSYEVYEVKIPYKMMVSEYTVPFIFLIDLQLTSLNANYVEAVANLMTEQSYIDFTIFDSVTTDESTYIYEATKHTKEKHKEYDETTKTTYETDEYDITSEQEGPDITITKVETNTIKASVTKAKTWIIDQEITYNLQENREYPYGEKPGKVETRSESEPGGEGTWLDPEKETWYEEIIKHEWVKGAVETKFMPSEFLGLWSNKTGTYVKGAPYVTKRRGGKLVEFKILEGAGTETPVTNIIISREQLYDLLDSNQVTQTHSEMMEEIINFYLSGEELTEETFESFTSMYDPYEFVEGSYVGDFDVHDESLFITDLETLKKAFKGGYSKSENLVENAQAFLDMQDKYKVNAIFAASVSITETGAGNEGNAIAYTGGINPRTGRVWQAVGSYNGEKWNNWFNVKTTSTTHYGIIYNGEGESHYKIYTSVADSIDGFGDNIANGSNYYKDSRYTVGAIGEKYCPNTIAYPHQSEDWISKTLSQITRFYGAAGRDISMETSPGNYSGDVIRYYQNDYANVPYGNSKASKYGTIATRGCGPTAFAMVATTLTGRVITPKDAISWCGDAYYVKDSGTSWAYFNAAARHYGFSCRQTSNFSQVEEALRNGKLVISSQSKGIFTQGGHYILLTKMVDGKIYVNDPNKNNAINKGYNNRGFTTSEITRSAKQYWIFE